MNYFLPPSALKETFAVPCAVIQKHRKLAGEIQLKVLLCGLCHLEWDFSAEKIADALDLSADEVNESLEFWADTGILCRAAASAAGEVRPTAVTGNTVKPGRADVARRGLESPEIAFLLNEAQRKFGRALRQNESSTLVWLYDDNGMPVSLLLMLLEYAESVGSLNIAFVERTAVRWLNDGILTVADAEAEIRRMNDRRSAFGTVASAMNLQMPRPTDELLECADLWVNQWGFGKETLAMAYDECVHHTGGFRLSYLKKILADWHKNGIKNGTQNGRHVAGADRQPPGDPPAATYDSRPELFVDEE